MAAKVGYCGQDPHRIPLRGDEIRPCWEAGQLSQVPAISAAVPPEDASTSPHARQFVEVRPVTRRVPKGAAAPAEEPIPAVPLRDEPRWSLWED